MKLPPPDPQGKSFHQHDSVVHDSAVPKLDKAEIVQATLKDAEKLDLVKLKKVMYPDTLTDIFKTLGQHTGIPSSFRSTWKRAEDKRKRKLARSTSHHRGR